VVGRPNIAFFRHLHPSFSHRKVQKRVAHEVEGLPPTTNCQNVALLEGTALFSLMASLPYAPSNQQNGAPPTNSAPVSLALPVPSENVGSLVSPETSDAIIGEVVYSSPEVAEAKERAPSLWNDAFLWALWLVGLAVSAAVVINARAHVAHPLLWLPAPMGVLGAAAGFVAMGRARDNWSGRTRFAWLALATAGALFGAGCVAGALPHHGEKAASSLWLAGMEAGQLGFVLCGLLALCWRGRALGLARLLGDTIIVALAIAVLLGSLKSAPPVNGHGVWLWKWVAGATPICVAAGGFLAVIMLGESGKKAGIGRASWLVAGGALCQLAAHFLVPSMSPTAGSHFPFPLAALANGWAFTLWGSAALVSARLPLQPNARDEENQDAGEQEAKEHGAIKTRPRWHNIAGVLPLGLALGAALSVVVHPASLGSGGAGPLSFLLLALSARQTVALWDNSQLVRRLRASSVDMERNVGERTHHLSTLHGITSTLNTSLDRRTVLRFTLEKTIAVTGADAGGIWLRELRSDIYESDAPQWEWKLMHWQGDGDPSMPALLRDLAIAQAAEGNTGDGQNAGIEQLSPSTREAMQNGLVPPRARLILVPVRSQGVLLGTMGLMRNEGAFSYDDRALVESVALEAGTALQNARMYSEAAHRANRDSVTDLANHRAVQEQMTATHARCKRNEEVFSIVMMDLNNFKFFNDTYGHPVGDEVLRTVARGLRESCRASDILGRYGGDEFIVVLPDTDAAGALDVCARIKSTLDSKHCEPVPGTRLPIGIAFGWASFPQDGENVADLLAAADANLYNHKRGGASYLSQSQKQLQTDKDEVKKLRNRAHGGSFGVLDALVTAIDNKDHYTRHHSEEVTFLSLLVARELGYSAEQLDAVRISGLLHDVGKIAVPDSILRHPGKLGRDEWDIMQQHPVFGALIVKDVPHLEHVLDGIKYHHEKWDGSGYPEKRVGEDIPEMGRLLAMGDCYSALTTDRPYRKGWKPEAALEEIERCAGAHFDPRLCALFLEVMRRELGGSADTNDYGARIADEFSAPRENAVLGA